MLSWVESAIRWVLKWWGEHWLRVQLVATPFGSLLFTLSLSQAENVGWWWNSQAEYEVAAQFASIGVLFYTASFAALETGVWLAMVLALQALEAFDRRRAKRDQGLRSEGMALTMRLVEELGVDQARILIERAREEKEPSETWEQTIERLKQEG